VRKLQKVYVEMSGGKYITWTYQGGRQFYLKTAYTIQEIIAWAKKNCLKLVQVIE